MTRTAVILSLSALYFFFSQSYPEDLLMGEHLLEMCSEFAMSEDFFCVPSLGIFTLIITIPFFSSLQHWKMYHSKTFEDCTVLILLGCGADCESLWSLCARDSCCLRNFSFVSPGFVFAVRRVHFPKTDLTNSAYYMRLPAKEWLLSVLCGPEMSNNNVACCATFSPSVSRSIFEPILFTPFRDLPYTVLSSFYWSSYSWVNAFWVVRFGVLVREQQSLKQCYPSALLSTRALLLCKTILCLVRFSLSLLALYMRFFETDYIPQTWILGTT